MPSGKATSPSSHSVIVRRFDHGEINRLAIITNTLSANPTERRRAPTVSKCVSRPSAPNTAWTAATAPNPGAPSAANPPAGSHVPSA